MAGEHIMKPLNLGGNKTMSFPYLFYKHIMFRKSCGICHFTNLQRPSDITLADFWGWQKIDKNINKDDKGVSLVFVNTEKGREIFEAIKDGLVTIPAEVDNCIQPQLQHPVELSPQRDEFEKDYVNLGFEATYRKYNKGEKLQLRRNYINRILRGLKRRIKSILI